MKNPLLGLAASLLFSAFAQFSQEAVIHVTCYRDCTLRLLKEPSSSPIVSCPICRRKIDDIGATELFLERLKELEEKEAQCKAFESQIKALIAKVPPTGLPSSMLLEFLATLKKPTGISDKTPGLNAALTEAHWLLGKFLLDRAARYDIPQDLEQAMTSLTLCANQKKEGAEQELDQMPETVAREQESKNLMAELLFIDAKYKYETAKPDDKTDHLIARLRQSFDSGYTSDSDFLAQAYLSEARKDLRSSTLFSLEGLNEKIEFALKHGNSATKRRANKFKNSLPDKLLERAKQELGPIRLCPNSFDTVMDYLHFAATNGGEATYREACLFLDRKEQLRAQNSEQPTSLTDLIGKILKSS